MRQLTVLACVWLMATGSSVQGEQPGVLEMEFLNGAEPPTRSCHASTIEMTPAGLVAAWFGGTHENHPDVGIWVVRQVDGAWTEPVEVVDGVQFIGTDGSVHRHPTWNPVLFQYPGGPLVLYYKCGPSPSTWWGMAMESQDHGATWSAATRLPEQIDGPVRNKPVLLDSGVLLCGSSTENDGWRVHFELTDDGGRSWQRTAPVDNGDAAGAIQPTILQHQDGRLEALCRDRNGEGQVLSTSSTDGGRTWSVLKSTGLPNPNSGIDAVTLQDGRFLLVYNHTKRRGTQPRGREMINLAVSSDAVNWQAAAVLDNESRAEFSYPAIIQSKDGAVHITYTWKRRKIRYVRVDPESLQLTAMDGDAWPKDEG